MIRRVKVGKIMQPKERTLFDEEEPQTGKPVEVPFAVALLALGSVRGLGQKGLEALVVRYGENLGIVLTQAETELTETLRVCKINGADKLAAAVTSDPKGLIKSAETQVGELHARGVRLLGPSQLPERLRAINEESPKWLFVEGDVSLLEFRPAVAVVGTRTPTENGLDAARVVATILGPYPVVMVSGLAEGIDANAHHFSLQHGIKNIAFLGHGINLVFPEETADLRHEIVRRGGAIVSEYLPSQTFQKRQFVERNRLQAALADLVIPVEAASASGTAHTIRFARRYSRPLVGMNWPGANGIVNDLRESHDRLIDIFTSAGQRELDALVQGVLKESQVEHYPFRNLERLATREFSNRLYTDGDVERLIETIRREAQQRKPQESSSDGST
jgi:DNA protecting protein DprA